MNFTFTDDWQDDTRYDDRSSPQLDDMSDWNDGRTRRSTANDVVDKVVDYINNAQPFGSPRSPYRYDTYMYTPSHMV